MLFEHYKIVADPEQELCRIDKFLLNRLPNVTRNKIQSGIRSGFVLINGQATKPNYKVRAMDEVKVMLPTPSRSGKVVPQEIAIDVFYEDEEVLVINKPAGMVVHPAYNNWEGTLVNALAHRFCNLPSRDGGLSYGIVHRLDKDTSGLLLVAKTEHSMSCLAKQFQEHSVERVYCALVWGSVASDFGTIDSNLSKNPRDRRIVIAGSEHGKKAITHYKVIERLSYVTLIECRLETGRTHQIRAHMSHLGHPIFGDALYGGSSAVAGPHFAKYRTFVDNCFEIMPTQALHAKLIGFTHPITLEKLTFSSSLPKPFEALLNKWSTYQPS
jgi:23S rRNA pseudouridine1911/1915/1917 synthase